jgi:dUTPase
MITKTKLWNLISTEMKTIKRLDEITETVMKKIKELETSNVENTNK